MMEFVELDCPYCGEPITVALDASAGDQRYTEDCQVCCRPIVLVLHVDDDGEGRLDARREDDA